MRGWIRSRAERRRRPVLNRGERYCPDCNGTRRTHWNIPALNLPCLRCGGTGKVAEDESGSGSP